MFFTDLTLSLFYLISNDFFSTIHRVDYHQILHNEAIRLGAVLRLGAEVTDISIEGPTALLADGTGIGADAIIGADGISHKIHGLTSSKGTDSNRPNVLGSNSRSWSRC